MNKLGTSLILVGIVGMLALPGCASKDAPGEEATSAAGGGLSTSTTGRGQIVTVEQFMQSGGQPLTSGGDSPGDGNGTTVYSCPRLRFTPSATITEIAEYQSEQLGHPFYSQAPVAWVHYGSFSPTITASKKVGLWYSTNEVACAVGLAPRNASGQSTAAVVYRKTFSPEKLCQFYRAPGSIEIDFICKDGPSPI